MGGVRLVNATDQDIVVNEGTGGIFRPIKTIPKGKVHVLKVDANETFREYRCKLLYEISQKSHHQGVALTSDDFAEVEQVTIRWDQTKGTLFHETKKRESGSNAAENPRFLTWLAIRLGLRLAPSGGGGSDVDVPRRGGAPDSWGYMLSSNG